MNDSRLTAAAWMIGGAAWVINGWLGLDAADGTGGFYASEVTWLFVHSLVLLGFVGLLRLTPSADSLSRRGFTIALGGRVVFLVAEIVAIVVADDEVVLLPLAAVLTSAGMIAGGIGTLRSNRWTGWTRFAPLVMGVYPLVAMFPILAATGERPNTSVTLWGMTIVAMGAAILATFAHNDGSERRDSPPEQTSREQVMDVRTA